MHRKIYYREFYYNMNIIKMFMNNVIIPGVFLEYNFRGGKSTFLEIEGGINKKSQG